MTTNPFRNDPHPDLTRAISEIMAPKAAPKPTPKAKGEDKHGKYEGKGEKKGEMKESHSRAELEKLGVARLRELKKKYEGQVAKGNRDASRELADVRGLLRSKGGGHALDEASACEVAARERLKAANAEDLKDKPGAAGKRAHRRLHKTIAGVVGESALDRALDVVCEELGITPEELLEMATTVGRSREHYAAITGAKTKKKMKAAVAKYRKERDSKKIYGKGGKVRGQDATRSADSPRRAKWHDGDKRDRKWGY
jgi:hypothetical protein